MPRAQDRANEVLAVHQQVSKEWDRLNRVLRGVADLEMRYAKDLMKLLNDPDAEGVTPSSPAFLSTEGPYVPV